MTNPNWHGVFPAVTTQFNEDESINYKSTQEQVDRVLSKVNTPKSWYAGMFDEIAKKLDGYSSDEVKLLNARESLEFVTAVYNSSRQGKNIHLPISKDNPFYNSWLPKK